MAGHHQMKMSKSGLKTLDLNLPLALIALVKQLILPLISMFSKLLMVWATLLEEARNALKELADGLEVESSTLLLSFSWDHL